MAKPTTAKPPATPDKARAAPSQAADALRAGVRAQRQHIKDLTGEDPLRGGVAD